MTGTQTTQFQSEGIAAKAIFNLPTGIEPNSKAPTLVIG